MNEKEIAAALPHADLIRAVLDGKTVQWRGLLTLAWHSDVYGGIGDVRPQQQRFLDLMINHPDNYEFRLVPEPVTRWHPVWQGGHTGDGFPSKAALLLDSNDNQYQDGMRCLRITLDPDTLEVINATTEAP